MKFIARHGQETLPVEVERHGGSYRVRLGDRWIEVDLLAANGFFRSLRLGSGEQFLLISHRSRAGVHEISFADRRVTVELLDPLLMNRRRSQLAETSASLCAMMPGRIVRVLVAEGEQVVRGQALLVLEAMKMENEIVAPHGGTVARLRVVEGQTVENGEELLLVVPASGE
ncbi:MAG: biotin/lipoyl-containing protein [Acidobacteriota bacterium]